MFHVINEYRVRKGQLRSTDAYGNNGAFYIPYMGITINCIASDGEGWEHVSVVHQGSNTPPSWSVMQYIKQLFWDAEDCVIQYHPPKSLYVNNHPHCLHLWKPIGKEIPIPDSKLIGII